MNKAFDAAAWNTWRRTEVEKSGNDPDAWVGTARNLVGSGALLTTAYSAALSIILRNVLNGGAATDRPRTPEEDAIVRRGHQTFSTGLMLFGFAIECLLKATYLRRGGKLYRDGRFKSPMRLKQSHNLLEIAEALGCSELFTEQQRDILDLLSAHNEMGRYPVHSKYDQYGIQPPGLDGVARFYGIWGVGRSATVFEILSVLYTELGEVIPDAADALLEQGRVQRSAYGQTDSPSSM